MSSLLIRKRVAHSMSKLGRIIATIAYTYVDSNWKDKMTVYNGTGISYDVIGNPVYDGTWTYTWEKGRQLKQMSKSGTTATFLYNADGLRIRKTVGSTVTNYTLHGKNHCPSGPGQQQSALLLRCTEQADCGELQQHKVRLHCKFAGQRA